MLAGETVNQLLSKKLANIFKRSFNFPIGKQRNSMYIYNVTMNIERIDQRIGFVVMKGGPISPEDDMANWKVSKALMT